MSRLVVLVSLLLAACSASVSVGNELNTDELADQIRQGIVDQTDVAGTVVCPDNIPLEQGNTFQCTFTPDGGQPQQVSVTQTDDQGNVDWELLQG